MMDVAFAARRDSCSGLRRKSACDENLRRWKHVYLAIALGVRHREHSGFRSRCPNRHASFAWGAGDELGMANTLGPATWQRCAQALANPKAKSYEVSHLRSNTMPHRRRRAAARQVSADRGHSGTVHAFNGERP